MDADDERLDELQEIADENGYQNLIFVDSANTTIAEIRKGIDDYKPTIVIVDQARNVIPNGKEGESKAGNLEKVFYQLRQLYKEKKVIGVSVTQAGDKDSKGKSLSDKMILEQSDIADSKYGVASQMDVMIGLGATNDMLSTQQAYLSVCKNKATNIHDGVQVTIDAAIKTITA
jgi:hypothetical protein